MFPEAIHSAASVRPDGRYDPEVDDALEVGSLGELSLTKLQVALDEFGLGQLIEASVTPNGTYGETCFITTDSGDYVFRGSPDADRHPRQEQRVVRLLHDELGLPVPWPHHVGGSEIFGWPFAIMKRMEGMLVTEWREKAEPDLAAEAALARQLGHTAARLHGCHADLVSQFDPETGDLVSIAADIDDFYVQRVGDVVTRSESYERPVFDDIDRAYIASVLESPPPPVFAAPTLTLVDFHDNNIVVQPRAGGCVVTGYFDFAFAHYGDSTLTLARPVAGYLRRHQRLAREFLDAYLGVTGELSGLIERLRFCVFAERVFVWEWVSRAGLDLGEETPPSFREWCALYLEGVDALA
jgi:hygromycin-B 7''-O-kinase